jgi:hypothetical protein
MLGAEPHSACGGATASLRPSPTMLKPSAPFASPKRSSKSFLPEPERSAISVSWLLGLSGWREPSCVVDFTYARTNRRFVLAGTAKVSCAGEVASVTWKCTDWLPLKCSWLSSSANCAPPSALPAVVV